MKSSPGVTAALDACREKMRQSGAAEWQIERFSADFARLGDEVYIPESVLEPLPEPPSLEELTAGSGEALQQTVVLKLNGGLGTSMGLEIPKSLVEVREGKNFLDLVQQQVSHLRQQTGQSVPLLLMNSFHTRQPCLERLAQHGFENQDLPLDFLQSQVPKLQADTLQPASYAAHPELEWCPPGHGEIYAALKGTGLLERLRQRGYRFAFVSNIDNLGATLDTRLLEWFAGSGLDFAMEVTRRTGLDKKGGHLASRAGKLILRERAQCQKDDLADFEDIDRHRYFNTNNLWLNLDAIAEQPLPALPLIVNRKTVDPTKPESTPVLQLESAMGAAIAVFGKTQAVSVPRSRFMPVKTLSDLMLLRSDLYAVDAAGHLQVTRSGPLPSIDLDSRFYGTYADFARRVQVVPELKECTRLRLVGDVRLVGPLRLQGEVHLENPNPEPLELG